MKTERSTRNDDLIDIGMRMCEWPILAILEADHLDHVCLKSSRTLAPSEERSEIGTITVVKKKKKDSYPYVPISNGKKLLSFDGP